MRSPELLALVLLGVALASPVGQSQELARHEAPAPPGCALVGCFPEGAGDALILDGELPFVPLTVATDGSAEKALRLINVERQDVGLPAYRLSPILPAIPVAHSTTMRDQACFDHQCPGEPAPEQRALGAGYWLYGWGACYLGETIAAGIPGSASVVAAWMQQAGHRAILLHDRLRDIGVGTGTGSTMVSTSRPILGASPTVWRFSSTVGRQRRTNAK